MAGTLLTGKPEVEGLGYAFLFRNYRAGLGKWQTSDPLGYPDGWNQMAYCGNEVMSFLDEVGCETVGVIEIHSSSTGSAGSFNTSGHSWITYRDGSTNQTTTYGTWGNNPTGQGNGLYTNLEQGMNSQVHRSCEIDQAQYDVLMGAIQEYRDRGAGAWSPTHPCSDFAADIWERVTGEDLSLWWIWDTPSDLVEAKG